MIKFIPLNESELVRIQNKVFQLVIAIRHFIVKPLQAFQSSLTV